MPNAPSQRKLDNALQGTAARAPQAAWRDGGAGALQLPRAPAQRPHRPGADRGQRGGLQAVSEKTPATGELLVQLLPPRRAFRPPWCNCWSAGRTKVRRWSRTKGIDGVLFTGSAHTGIAINRKLAARPDKIVALEMGGNNPMVVWDTPKITDAAALIVQSAFTSAGQRCTAARRLIVKASMYDALIGRSESAWPTGSSLARRLTIPRRSWAR